MRQQATSSRNINVVMNGVGTVTELQLTQTGTNLITLAISKALNCWDQAPAELKELGDLLTHGRITQNYREQQFAKQRSEESLLEKKNKAIPSLE